jgi:hypothetical protein
MAETCVVGVAEESLYAMTLVALPEVVFPVTKMISSYPDVFW